jgi:hypothetical protein
MIDEGKVDDGAGGAALQAGREIQGFLFPFTFLHPPSHTTWSWRH